VLYTVANSNAMNEMVPGSKITYGVAPWQYGLWGGSAALVALAAFFGYKAVKNHKLMGTEGTDGDAADVPEVKKGKKKASDEK
jgi:beta-glucosidase